MNGDLLREIAMMARSPRKWWRGTYMVPCPVCQEKLSIRGGMWSDWRSHRAIHGNEAWKAALRDAQDGAK